MKYLPKETCEYLASLGCTSESGMYRADEINGDPSDTIFDENFRKSWDLVIKGIVPAFSLEDILRKDNAEKIWGQGRQAYMAVGCVYIYRDHPDTWPEEVSKLILPDGRP
jgi:hypothetical protein